MRLIKYILTVFMAACLMTIAACSRQEHTPINISANEAIHTANTYKKSELEAALPSGQEEIKLQRQEKTKEMGSLTTAAFFSTLANSQDYSPGPEIAFLRQHRLQITYISFSEVSTTETSIELSYTGTLRFGEAAADKLALEGTMILINDLGIWKVDSDSYNSEDISGLLDLD
ncbi:hypothetical protein [Paenibacillus typhae]|uniref:hypothetical protein n=1 Tax=Paenibacillus typhae TaxID=1174501 RepID=UPI001C8DEE47|nr:hypothetical protein [Paenibacillus typhae]MBY0013891.1 hypothetical protein [Paenibacillus typhae]